jgi:hypothetical protein
MQGYAYIIEVLVFWRYNPILLGNYAMVLQSKEFNNEK